MASALLFCTQTYGAPSPVSNANKANIQNYDSPFTVFPVDKAVITAALENFSQWKSATYGIQEGVLEAAPNSLVISRQEMNGIKSFSDIIKNYLTDDIVDSFMQRNKSASPIAALISGSPSVRLQQSPHTTPPDWLPDGVRATGSLTLPGFNADGTRAFVEIHHSWSVHGAITMFILSLDQGQWKVIARDQMVFL
jgi:hypothetical protein